MSQTINVSKKFMEDFKLVIEHFGHPPKEIEELKRAARKDYSMVSASLADTAEKIKAGKFGKKVGAA
jgi:hypothetical protein